MKPATLDKSGHSKICTVGVSQHFSLSKYKDQTPQYLNIGITDDFEVKEQHYTTLNGQQPVHFCTDIPQENNLTSELGM